jgi:flagellar hook-associated protein 3 FlgL
MTAIPSPNAAALPSGLLGLLVGDSAGIQSRLTQITEQSSTGLVAQTYGGMGVSAQISLNLRPQLAEVSAYSQNISSANAQLGVTGQVLGQLEQIASTFSSGLLGVNSGTSQEVDTLSSQATAALSQVQSLLNTQVGDKYIFAGQDSANPPLPNATFNAYVQGIQTAMGGLAANGSTATIAATLTAATTASPFSATLGTTPELVSVGLGVTTPVGIVAGQNAYVTQTGAGTTGSYVRDLIRSLATVASLSSGQMNTDGTNVAAVVADTQTNLQNVITAINTESTGAGAAQQSLTTDQTNLTDTQTALTNQISSAENVDAAATATALTQAQAQLQISYKLIASTQAMSLLTYLPVA